jgi:signal transduction histidine kinase
MNSSDKEQLRHLAQYLTQRRPLILRAWHQSVNSDPELATASSISRTQFYDHIPQLVDAFADLLCAEDGVEKKQASAEQKKSAGEHGLHRWQQGYNQSQTMREWAHLHLCLLDELERYAVSQPSTAAGVMHFARRELARLCGDGVCESAARYARLQQVEAASRLRDLEQAVQHLRAVERERAERWREAAHDLRSTVHVVTTAAAVLDREGVAETARVRMSQALHRGTAALHALLADLMDLARLEAGHERRKLVRFDAAQMLKAFCEPLRAMAAERNLFLQTEGLAPFPVEGDPVKVQRIVQNLLMNALNATSNGGVRVTWAERAVGDREQWILCVQDTGPGLDGGTAAPLQRALNRATEEAQEVEEQADPFEQRASENLDPAPTLTSRSPNESSRNSGGEGIGLSIVKRLCELLDASLELETSPGAGTTFRVIFPRQYDDPPTGEKTSPAPRGQ